MAAGGSRGSRSMCGSRSRCGRGSCGRRTRRGWQWRDAWALPTRGGRRPHRTRCSRGPRSARRRRDRRPGGAGPRRIDGLACRLAHHETLTRASLVGRRRDFRFRPGERGRRSPVSSSAPAWAQAARHRAARRPARPRRAGTRRRLAASGPRMKPRRAPGPAPRAERRDATLHGRPCAGRGRLARLRSTTSGSSHRSRGRCKCPGLPCWSAPAHGQARRRGFSWATGGSVLSDRGAAQRSGSRAWRGLTFSHNAGDSYTRAPAS